MTGTTKYQINAGFLPLVDAAILIAAKEKGFAEDQGIDLNLIKETSWANIRDRMAVGHFDVAHMLAPMPLAAAFGLMPLPLKILAPMAMGIGGNAITVSNAVYASLEDHETSQSQDRLDPKVAGAKLCSLITKRHKNEHKPLVFGVVHPFSGHNYELRYWLAASGINPDKDVEIIIVPPPLMPDALKSGAIDGYCVGEPWNSVAVAAGHGRILTTKSRIWKTSPEKILGVSQNFNDQQPEKVEALIRALYEAAQWCNNSTNVAELAQILSKSNYLGLGVELIANSIEGNIDTTLSKDAEFFNCFERAATFPWLSHAEWFYSQMVRWGHATWVEDAPEKIRDCYRPDIYRKALSGTNSILPSANAKVEGALLQETYVGTSKGALLLGPDGFFDGQVFDPNLLHSYIKSQRSEN